MVVPPFCFYILRVSSPLPPRFSFQLPLRPPLRVDPSFNPPPSPPEAFTGPKKSSMKRVEAPPRPPFQNARRPRCLRPSAFGPSSGVGGSTPPKAFTRHTAKYADRYRGRGSSKVRNDLFPEGEGGGGMGWFQPNSFGSPETLLLPLREGEYPRPPFGGFRPNPPPPRLRRKPGGGGSSPPARKGCP